MKDYEENTIHRAVRKNYGKIATAQKSGCCSSGCCQPPANNKRACNPAPFGYSCQDIDSLPEGAVMGLGCGNPLAIAELQLDETVLDLGCGGGIDCILAARAVGDGGFVIGVDMTPEMIERAQKNAEEGKLRNLEFRLGQLEHLPVADESVDVIISNCVINLSPEKKKVFAEAFRVLRPGGRLAISDIVSTGELPEKLKQDMVFHVGCIAGASSVPHIQSMLLQCGFTDIEIVVDQKSRTLISEWMPGSGSEDFVASAAIMAVKPGT